MSNKIGRFEILSELSHSELCTVYKATDPDSGQTVALKALKLEALGERAAALVKQVLDETEAAKPLNSPNIAALYGAGEMEGQFCSSLEYVQGNSVGTALAQHDGFSIWDIQDITRQVCQAFDHAAKHKVVHYSLEPSKIMSGWDGTVKILGFGISTMGAQAAKATGKPPDCLYYMSPEQLRGDALDTRSNLFSLGAILYEMATEQKAFPGEDADQVRQQLRENMPPAPIEVNRKVHPVLSDLIMKALAKDPEQRYQSGRDLVVDLEQCKDSPAKRAETKKTGEPQKGLMGAPVRKPQESVKPAVAAPEPKPAETAVVQPEKAPAAKAASAAAGVGSGPSGSTAHARIDFPKPNTPESTTPRPAPGDAASGMTMKMSSAVAEPEVESPKIKIDPAMDENRPAAAGTGKSFSDISELPPMKPVFIATPKPATPEPEPAPETANAVQAAVFKNASPEKEKPKIQPREIAKKAATEIKKTPPKLFMYAIAGAIGIILLIVVGIAFRIHSANSDDDGAPVQSAAPVKPAEQAAPAPAAQPSAESAAAAPAPEQVQPEAMPPEPQVSVTPKYKGKKAKAAPAAAVATPGQLTINSTPAGAQLQVDGHTDPAWLTPYNMAGLTPGSHTVVLSKPGYSSETRTIDVASGSKSFIAVQLAAVTASVSLTSDPAGASVLMDGKDTGKVTPTQITVDKLGSHTFILRKAGYLDESTTASLQAAQVFRFTPSLRALGSTDDIKIGGKFKKMFGGADKSGMGSVEIKTLPKGAQVAVNNRIIDKNSPVEFYLDPGNYVIDVTYSGYQTIHRVVTVDKGGKVVIDETMQRQ